MRVLLALVLACTTSPAAAWSFCDGWLTPPAEHQRQPTAQFEIARIPGDMVPVMCMVEWVPPSVFAACTEHLEDGSHMIYVSRDLLPTEIGCLVFHERSHIPPNNFQHGGMEDEWLPHQGAVDELVRRGEAYAPRLPSPWAR